MVKTTVETSFNSKNGLFLQYLRFRKYELSLVILKGKERIHKTHLTFSIPVPLVLFYQKGFP